MINLRKIHKVLVGGQYMILLYIALAFLGRIFAGITFQEYIPWVVFVMQTGIAILLLYVNYECKIIIKKTVLPAAFFLLATAFNPDLYNDVTGCIVALIFIVCLILTLRSYHNDKSQTASFYVALIFTAGSVFCWTPFLFFIPLFWIGFYWLRAFNRKSFLASLIGIFTVYLFLTAWCLYLNDWDLLEANFLSIGNFFEVRWIELPWIDWLLFVAVVALLVVVAIKIFVSGFSEKVRTSLIFQFFYFITIALFILSCLFFSEMYHVLLIFDMIISYVIGYYFATSENNKWATYLLLFTILSFIIVYMLRIDIFFDYDALIARNISLFPGGPGILSV